MIRETDVKLFRVKKLLLLFVVAAVAAADDDGLYYNLKRKIFKKG
jgi:hypothetical protein